MAIFGSIMLYDDILENQKNKLLKAIQHLEYSYNKVLKLPVEISELDEESLETWESFAARFCRVSDIFLAKYLKTTVLLNDPGFTGTLRDFMNQAEKIRLIEDVEAWMAIRELRNISAHDYTDKDLALFFKKLREETPQLLAIKHKL